MIDRISRVELREVWPREATDFTKWLEGNIDLLNEALGLTITSVRREEAVGTFAVDLLGEDDQGDVVVIENQLAASDHRHLGQLLTYVTNLDAKAAVWIVSDPRPEHVKAVGWLNESTAVRFYLVKIEAVRIGLSPPAPLLTLIVGPSEESRVAGETRKEIAERANVLRRFWTELLPVANAKTRLHSGVSPNILSWLSAGAGRGGMTFQYVVRDHATSVQLNLDLGSDGDTSAAFDALAAVRSEIETTFGGPLEWDKAEGRRVCRIRKLVADLGLQDEEKWPSLFPQMADAMARLERALKPQVAKLDV